MTHQSPSPRATPLADTYRSRNRDFVVRKKQEAREHRTEARRDGNTALVAALDAVIAGYGRSLQDMDNPGRPGWLEAELGKGSAV